MESQLLAADYQDPHLWLSISLASPSLPAGHVKDSNGKPLLHFCTEILLQRQECTRDDDWSLHLMHVQVLEGDVRFKLLVERTGEDALRCNCSEDGGQPHRWLCRVPANRHSAEIAPASYAG